MDNSDPSPQDEPQKTADWAARTFFGADSNPASGRRVIHQLILSALGCAILIPLIFYLRFGEVSPLGWGTTIFFVVYGVLAAIGLYFRPRTEYHTRVTLWGDWLDRIGAFWLVSCVFGPLLGWVITAVFPLTVDSWQGLYSLRVILAAGLPLLTALPLTRYIRGKAARVALPLLVGVTLLPIWSVAAVSRDLQAGPIVRQVSATGQQELYLKYTDTILGSEH
jgi:hypothetical protein